MITSLIEKVMLFLDSPCFSLGNSEDITFAVNTSLAYFFKQELELPPLENPPSMASAPHCRVLLSILGGRYKR